MKPRVALTRDDKARLFKKPEWVLPNGIVCANEAHWNRGMALHLAALQSWRCFWCGQRMSNIDPESPTYRTLEHVIGKAAANGNHNALTNLRAACKYCNNLRGEMQGLRKEIAQNKRIGLMLEAANRTIERHRITMAGRCSWCKFKFHFKEWLWKRRHRKEKPDA